MKAKIPALVYLRLLAAFLLAGVLAACSYSAPEGLASVDDFDIHRYTGQWYEIAHLDHRFEHGSILDSAVYESLIEQAGNNGFATEQLIKVEQQRNLP